MKIIELSQKPKNELQTLLSEKRERLRQLRFNISSGKVKNVREIRMIKKDIARILTILKNRASTYGSEGEEKDEVLFAHKK